MPVAGGAAPASSASTLLPRAGDGVRQVQAQAGAAGHEEELQVEPAQAGLPSGQEEPGAGTAEQHEARQQAAPQQQQGAEHQAVGPRDGRSPAAQQREHGAGSQASAASAASAASDEEEVVSQAGQPEGHPPQQHAAPQTAEGLVVAVIPLPALQQLLAGIQEEQAAAGEAAREEGCSDGPERAQQALLQLLYERLLQGGELPAGSALLSVQQRGAAGVRAERAAGGGEG